MFDVKNFVLLMGVAVLCFSGCKSVYEETKEQADAGDADAQWRVAMMLFTGEDGAERNSQLAEEYMLKAKKQKKPLALLHFMEKICKTRDVSAYDDFISMLSDVPSSYDLAITYFVILMEDGHTEEALNLRKLLQEKSLSQMKADLEGFKAEIARAKMNHERRKYIAKETARQKWLADSIALIEPGDGRMFYLLQKRTTNRSKAQEWLKKSLELKYPLAALGIMRAIAESKSSDKAEEFVAAVAVCFGNKKYILNEPGKVADICLKYFSALVEKKEDDKAWAVQKALRQYAIPYFESQTAKFQDQAKKDKKFQNKYLSYQTKTQELQQKLGRVVTAAEKQKRLAELEKNPRLKYPLDNGTPAGIKLYKNMFSGTSLNYLSAVADINGEKLETLPFFMPEAIEKKFQYGEGWRTASQYLYAPVDNHKIIFGVTLSLNVSFDSLIAKYQKEFPGIKVYNDRKERLAANRKKLLDTSEGRSLYRLNKAEFERTVQSHTPERFSLENDRVFIFIREKTDMFTGEAIGIRTIIVIDKKYEALCAETCKKARADAAAKKKAEEEKKLNF